MYLFEIVRFPLLNDWRRILFFQLILLHFIFFAVFNQPVFAQDIAPESSESVLRVRKTETPKNKTSSTDKNKGAVNTISKRSKTIKKTDQTVIQTISFGVINGKSINLPTPPYPPAAKAVHASGAVNVQVLIDENGDVVSAIVVSGHPLLRAAAEDAARKIKFEAPVLGGKPIRVKGIIAYNFTAQ